jgi:hypothetical protein
MSEMTAEKAREMLENMVLTADKVLKGIPTGDALNDSLTEILKPDMKTQKDFSEFILTALDQLRWRDAEKELPEYGERVIATDGDFVGEMYLYNSEWARDGWFWELNKHTKIIAWLPLPTPPEVIKNA